MSRRGSEMRWGNRDSRVCAVCGRRLRLSDTFRAEQQYRHGRLVASVSFCEEHM